MKHKTITSDTIVCGGLSVFGIVTALYLSVAIFLGH